MDPTAVSFIPTHSLWSSSLLGQPLTWRINIPLRMESIVTNIYSRIMILKLLRMKLECINFHYPYVNNYLPNLFPPLWTRVFPDDNRLDSIKMVENYSPHNEPAILGRWEDRAASTDFVNKNSTYSALVQAASVFALTTSHSTHLNSSRTISRADSGICFSICTRVMKIS